MTGRNIFNRVLSVLLCMAMLLSYMPMMGMKARAVDAVSADADILADAGTAHTWESMMGSVSDGNRYAGRVWADKSVYLDGQTALLNTSGAPGSTFQVDLAEDEAFQVIFSALGSSMTSTTTNTYVGPMDVVLVFDTSTSMRFTVSNKSRLQHTIEAANLLIDQLLQVSNVRLGIVTYNSNSEIVLPLDFYPNGVTLSVNHYTNTYGGGVVSAYDDDNNLLGKDSGYSSGTNLQSGIDTCMRMLYTATNAQGRVPVAMIMTDGEANRGVRNNWYDVPNGTVSSSGSTGITLSTLLNAAYGRACVTKHYGKAPTIYGVGADLDAYGMSQALMNPAAANGFNSNNSDSSVTAAYTLFTTWSTGSTVTSGYGSSQYTFDHNLPDTYGVTSQDVADNINYVDDYYNVTSDQLEVTFSQIYEELKSGVFNPITSSETVTGGTGVKDTPLVYVDHIGQHMEIKSIQAVTLFGASFDVIKNADGTYTVEAGTGVNPTTGEAYDLSQDIRISVTEDAKGNQTLRIEIFQEALPIILEQILSETNNGVTNAVINEMTYNPLRVFYTVGLDSDIFLPTGQIDVTKLADDYAFIDDATGEISFYSNYFGTEDGQRMDTHVGFKPSAANRYYYHQSNMPIYSNVTASSGSIQWSADDYGVLKEEGKYNLTAMTYADYLAMGDSETVYTEVTYYRPTASTADAGSAAEQVTYIVYTLWQYLKESVAFYDSTAGVYINATANGYTTGKEGYAMAENRVESVIEAYLDDHPNANIQAALGVGSLRTSRLHNMTVAKENNVTGTAALRYEPQYTYETAEEHSGNDVVIWLGNNGKLTTTIATGIALTKAVTEAIGDPNDTYALTVTLPAGVNANPVVMDAEGNNVTAAISTYASQVLTVNLKAGETVYISGIPVGTVCAIGEDIQGDYYIDSKTDSVTIPTLSQVLAGTEQYVPAVVTNAPYKYGSLYITKELTSDHAIPDSVQQQSFALTVHVGTELAGQSFTVNLGEEQQASAQVDDQGNLNLTIQAQQTLEILDLPEGIQVTISEELTAQQQVNFVTTYRTRNQSGQDADTDNIVTIPAGAHATAIIHNFYTPQSTTVDLDIAGTKNFITEDVNLLQGGSFTFLVQSFDGTDWTDIATANVPYAAGESGIKTFLLENVLQGITFSQVGTWSYRVLEVKGALENLTYDRTLYIFTVTVTDNGGQLVASITDLNQNPITDGSYEVTFTNTYHTAPVSIDVTKVLNNLSGDSDVSKAGFAFTAVQTDSSWNVLADGASLTVYTGANGIARFAATYTAAGVYHYLVSEVNSGLPGWTYSAAQYRVTVTVTEEDGNLTSAMTIEAVEGTTADGETASVSGNAGAISFVNTYDPADITVDLDAAVKKNLTGKSLADVAFTFYVRENGGTTAILTGTSDANGNVTFDGDLFFDRAGKYEFDIVEFIPDGAVLDSTTGKYVLHGMAYDPTIYDLVVEVVNDQQTGQLKASFYFEDSVSNVVTFYNVYSVTPTSYTLSGLKVLNGRAMAAEEFTFLLYDSEGNPLQTVKNKTDGTFAFDELTFTAAGVYTYTIREAVGSAPGVTYTGAQNPIEVTITVTDTNGILSAEASVANADIVFENTYTPENAEIIFQGTKTMQGAMLTDGSFNFRLYATDASLSLENATLVDEQTNANGAFVFDTVSFSQTGTYFYVIVEDATFQPLADVVYDARTHAFRVQVSDVGDGQLRVEIQDLVANTTAAPTASATVTVGFVNATFDEVTQKEVFLGADTVTQIDGQQVQAGAVLTYYLTYRNFTGKDVIVDIADVIPNHTTYVQGSASHGGDFAGDHVHWTLSVPKDGSVVVSFQVTVNETDVIVPNTAIIRDGVNTYRTNEVINHTFAEEAVKDVFSPSDLTASIQDQAVALGDVLHYTVTFHNTTGEAVTAQIADRIPANTEYVENSASHNGVFAEGGLSWTVEVDAWSSITVSFQVRVTATEICTIQNQATVTVGSTNHLTNVVSNPHTPLTTGFTVRKVWVDNDDQDGIRPESITVYILAGGTRVDTITLTAEGGWTATLENLDKYANGSLITYTVEEAVIEGYGSAVTGSVEAGFAITNTHETEETQITVTKVWDDKDDQDGKRPDSVTVHLLSDGQHTGKNVVLSEANGWTYTWTGLDAYAGGEAINYTVFEEDVAEYTVNYTRDEADDRHVIITNSYTPGVVSFTVQKVWVDNYNQDGIRPGSVTVELLADGQSTGITATLTEETHWRYTFTGLDEKAAGEAITYTVIETEVPEDYTVTYRLDEQTGIYEVVNTHEVYKTSVSVNKVWNDADNQDGIRPDSVTVELLADGQSTGKTLTLNEQNGWTATFEGLDRNYMGRQIVYTVAEVEVPEGYTAAVTGTAAQGYTVTNTHEVEKTQITIHKVWDDANDQDGIRPDSVMVQVYANGQLYTTVELTAAADWTLTLQGLDKYAAGTAISYTINEMDVPDGYIIKSISGLTITNSHTPATTSITVSKVWNDENDQDGKRPDSITVHLLASGEHTGLSVVLSEENGWTHTWTGLDQKSAGTDIIYTVYEEEVAEYSVEYTRDPADDNHVIITNSYTPGVVSFTVQKVWADNYNQDGLRTGSVTVELLANGQPTGITATLNEANHWRFTFTGLDEKANGEAITYTVIETEVPAGYQVSYRTDAQTGIYEVINTHIPEKTSVSVSKVWDDANDQDGLRTDSVTVELFADGVTTGKTLILSEQNGWAAIFEGLDKKHSGKDIRYTVEEVNVPTGYTATIIGTAAQGFVVTNTHTPEKTAITIHKVWQDNNNQDGLRPASIVVEVYANGQLIRTVELSVSGGWSATLEGLDKFANGKEITYTVDEINVPDGYTKSVSGLTITNSYTPATTSITVTKVWDDADDQDGKRPASITVHLLASGEHTGLSVVLSEENGWTHTWTGLDKKAAGIDINYTVYEEEVADYDVEYTRDPADDSHVIITNSYTPGVTSFTVQKVWDDNHNQDGLRPGSITVELLANGQPTGITATLSEENHWRFTFTDIAKMAGGVDITYTAREIGVPQGYTSTGATDADTGIYEIVNTYRPATTQITIQKIWEDGNNQDGLRPQSLEIRVLADGEHVRTVTLTAAAGWTFTLGGLPKFANGTEIIYTIDEPNVPFGYTKAISGFVITNFYTPAETSLTVTKEWDDGDNRDGLRPSSVTVHLLADGQPTGQSVVLSDANGWTYTWTGLAAKAAGQDITYSVSEDPVPGYSATYAPSGNQVTITNYYRPHETSITIQKIWSDGNNQDGLRPGSITVLVYANGKVVTTATISAANGWVTTVTGLAKNDGGTPIVYTVSEASVAGYTSFVSGDMATGFTIVNSHTPATISIPVHKVWNDADNQDGKRPDSVTVALLADGVDTGLRAFLNEENLWLDLFVNLPVYANGRPIDYTIEELDVPDCYTVTYAGFVITNTYVPETTAFSVEKQWADRDDLDGLRPDSIRVELLANGKGTGRIVVLSEENGWAYTWEELPVYENGDVIVYFAEEVDIPEGYSAGYINTAEGTTIINTHIVEEVTVSVSKLWNDADNQDGKRPASIRVELLANGQPTGQVLVLSAENGWAGQWTGLLKLSGGEVVDYTVRELDVAEGYTCTIEGSNNAFTLTNTYAPELTSVSVSKLWNDAENQDGKRPASVRVELLANGQPTGKVLVLSAENGWAGAWAELAKFENGQVIAYTVRELEVAEGYTCTIEGSDNAFTLTNTYAPELTSVSVSKLWNDAENQDGKRPDSIRVELLANGQPTGKVLVLSAENGWAGAWAELAKFENGQAIAYTVRELEVAEGYTCTIEGSDNVFTLTNTYVPQTTSVTITKLWDDNHNLLNMRPEDVTVQLLANGQSLGEAIVLNKDNGWTYTFEKLNLYADGQAIVYTVQEIEVAYGYEVSYAQREGSDGSLIFEITNLLTYVPEPPPQTGDSFAPMFLLMIISMASVLVLGALGKKRRA